MNDGGWVIAGSIQCSPSSMLYAMNKFGVIQWNLTDIFLNEVTDVDTLGDKIYSICSKNSLISKTDNLAEYEGDAIIRINSASGSTLYNSYALKNKILLTIDPAYTNHCQGTCREFYQLAVVDSDHLLVSLGNYLAYVSIPTQTVVWSKQFNSYINDFVYNTPYTYLATDNGFFKVLNDVTVDSNTTLTNALQCYKSVTNVMYYLNNDKIVKTDSSLQILSSYTLTDTFSKSQSITGSANNIFVTGIDKMDSAKKIAVFDFSLNLQHTFPLIADCDIPTVFSANDSTLLVARNPYITTVTDPPFDTSYNTTVTTYLFNGTAGSASSSASLLDVEFVSHTVYFQQAIDMVMALKIVNTGSDTITSLRLCFYPNYCGFIDYNGLSIAPGDTGIINDVHYNFSLNPLPDEGTFVSIPWRILTVNGQTQANVCNSLFISGPYFISSVDEIPATGYHIFPNPTSHILNIQTDNVNTTSIFTLRDLTGRTLLQRTINDNNIQMDLSNLSQGLYIYSIKSGNTAPLTGKVEKL